MAQILSFNAPESRNRSPQSGDGDATGEVILFPGVRYERWNELHDEASPRRRHPNERDVLELAE